MSASTAKSAPERVVEVTRDQLPLSCPPPGADVYSMHPRVWLPIEKSGEAVCPYCGTRYVLRER